MFIATETALDARKELAEKKVSGVTFTNSSSLSTSESLPASSSTYFESSKGIRLLTLKNNIGFAKY